MDKDHTEIFGLFSYAENLTYEEVLEIEDGLTDEIGELLLLGGAEHVDFTPLGDSLSFQCDCAGYKQYVFRKLAIEIAAILPQSVTGRMLCLNHGIKDMHVYWLRKEEWIEEKRSVSSEPPSELKVHQVRKKA